MSLLDLVGKLSLMVNNIFFFIMFLSESLHWKQMVRKGLLIVFFPWSCLWDLLPLTSGYLSVQGHGVSSSAIVGTMSDYPMH